MTIKPFPGKYLFLTYCGADSYRKRLKRFKAFSADCFLIAARLPRKINFLQIVSFLLVTQIKTVPTGFLGIAPVGPAIPVMPIPRSVLAILRIFFAIREATSFETAPFLAIVEAGIFRIFTLV